MFDAVVVEAVLATKNKLAPVGIALPQKVLPGIRVAPKILAGMIPRRSTSSSGAQEKKNKF